MANKLIFLDCDMGTPPPQIVPLKIGAKNKMSRTIINITQNHLFEKIFFIYEYFLMQASYLSLFIPIVLVVAFGSKSARLNPVDFAQYNFLSTILLGYNKTIRIHNPTPIANPISRYFEICDGILMSFSLFNSKDIKYFHCLAQAKRLFLKFLIGHNGSGLKEGGLSSTPFL